MTTISSLGDGRAKTCIGSNEKINVNNRITVTGLRAVEWVKDLLVFICNSLSFKLNFYIHSLLIYINKLLLYSINYIY